MPKIKSVDDVCKNYLYRATTVFQADIKSLSVILFSGLCGLVGNLYMIEFELKQLPGYTVNMEGISIEYILFLIFTGAAILATFALSMRQASM